VSSCLWKPVLRSQLLLLADTEATKKSWIEAINNSKALMQRHQIEDKSVFRPTEAYDSNLPLIKSALSAAIIDKDRIALGTEEGLFIIELRTDEILRVGDAKKIHQLEVLRPDDVIVAMCGRNRQIRLFPIAGLESGDSVKVDETKNCSNFATGLFCQGSTTCVCVAVKKHVLIFELNATRLRHRKVAEINLPMTSQYLSVINERMCVGYSSGFALYSLQGGTPIQLLNCDDSSLDFLQQISCDALCAVPVAKKEFLLCFSSCGVYVSRDGRRSRQQELMWPATPTAIVRNKAQLLVFSENAIDVFDFEKITWQQTIPLKKVRPLASDGSLALVSSMEPFKLIFMERKTPICDELDVSDTTSVGQRQLTRKSKKRSLFKVPVEEHRLNLRNELLRNPERKDLLISLPRDFNHVAHMGPDDGIRRLRHLPVAAMTQQETLAAASHDSEPPFHTSAASNQDTDPASGMDNLSFDSGSSVSLPSSENSFISSNNLDKFNLNWE